MLNRSVKVEKLAQGTPVGIELSAGDEDRAVLADRFGWMEVSSLDARLEARLVAAGAYDVTGRIEAAIVQRCRTTGNPVPESIAIDVHERFVAGPGEGAAEIDPMAVSVEAIDGGVIPVGEMVAQLVGLEASAWPRDPQAEGIAPPVGDPGRAGPFASLAELKKKH